MELLQERPPEIRPLLTLRPKDLMVGVHRVSDRIN
jgi:hypothetical protein